MSRTLQSILGDEALAAFEAPGAVACGLPAAAYTSEAFFALENDRIFSESWVFVGLAHELAQPGDVVPVTVAGKPVLLVRDAGRAVRAFHNVCRHRCLKLVEEPGNVGPAIQCPYHTWTYKLDGALHSTPYFGGSEPLSAPAGFDRAQYGLVPVRVATWHDWIFVNLNGSAPPLEDVVAPLERRFDGLDLTQMRHVVTVDLGEIAANWKLLMENFIEPYHVPFVHATTTEQPLTDHYTLNEPGCLGCAVDVSGEAKRDDTLSADSRYLTIFPNFSLGIYFPDQVGVHLDVPLAPDLTLQRRAIYSLKSRAAHGRTGGAARDALARRARGGPGHLRAAPGGAGIQGRRRRRRALPGVGGLGAELPGARGEPPALNARSRWGPDAPRRGGVPLPAPAHSARGR